MTSIKGLDKADVLKALYDASHEQGMSFMALPHGGVTEDMCRVEIATREAGGTRLYFDYWHGHVLKVDLSGDEFDPRLFDRDNYPGAAEDAIRELRTRPEAAA